MNEKLPQIGDMRRISHLDQHFLFEFGCFELVFQLKQFFLRCGKRWKANSNKAIRRTAAPLDCDSSRSDILSARLSICNATTESTNRKQNGLLVVKARRTGVPASTARCFWRYATPNLV
jgi:hypothetical protein